MNKFDFSEPPPQKPFVVATLTQAETVVFLRTIASESLYWAMHMVNTNLGEYGPYKLSDVAELVRQYIENRCTPDTTDRSFP